MQNVPGLNAATPVLDIAVHTNAAQMLHSVPTPAVDGSAAKDVTAYSVLSVAPEVNVPSFAQELCAANIARATDARRFVKAPCALPIAKERSAITVQTTQQCVPLLLAPWSRARLQTFQPTTNLLGQANVFWNLRQLLQLLHQLLQLLHQLPRPRQLLRHPSRLLQRQLICATLSSARFGATTNVSNRQNPLSRVSTDPPPFFLILFLGFFSAVTQSLHDAQPTQVAYGLIHSDTARQQEKMLHLN